MKLLDILESQTNEAPMGFVSKALTQAGAKLPGTMGLKQQGKLATGDLANNLYNEYAQFLGRAGLPPNGDSIKKFLQTKNVDPSYVDAHLPNGTLRLSSGKLENVFLAITRDYQSGSPRTPTAAPGPSPTPTGTPTPPAADTPVTFAQIMSSLHTLSYTDLRNLKRQLDLTLAPP